MYVSGHLPIKVCRYRMSILSVYDLCMGNTAIAKN